MTSPSRSFDVRFTLPEAAARDVAAELDEWLRGGKVARLWGRDASLWTGADESAWLGWLDIIAAQRAGPGRRVADVEVVGPVRRPGVAVGQRQHQVHPDHLVAVRLEDLADRGADEARRAGEQDPHGIS